MNVRNHRIYSEVIWEWNESTQQLEQTSEQSELYSGNLALASGPGLSGVGANTTTGGADFGDCNYWVDNG